MRYVCLLALFASVLYAQDGAALYKERCASCHDAPGPRVPALSAIKAMSGEAIYRTLTSGVMKTEAAGLSTAQLFSLIGFIAPTGGLQTAAPAPAATCKGGGELHFGAGIPQWNGWSPSPSNSRFEEAHSAGLSAADLPKLKLKWAFNLGEVTEARSQPIVVGDRVFVTSSTGLLYALDAESGCTRWAFRAGAGIRAGAVVGESKGNPAVFFSDGGGTLYAVNAETGALLWKVRPVDHFATIATATPVYHEGVLYQTYSSFEEALAGDPKYGCCTFRGSVAAVDAASGQKLWQTFTIAEPAKPTAKSGVGTQLLGPSGAGIWSSPTMDEQNKVLYVATGDNYSDPPTDTSDAILALDLKSGKLLWSAQLTRNDAYNNGCGIPIPGSCPEVHGADADFGQPPILVSLGGKQRALVIAQKSGMAYAIDPDEKGKILWQTRVGVGGPLGGSQWGSASDGDKVFVATSDVGLSGVADPKSPNGYRLVLDPKKGGGLHALDLKSGKIVWNAPAAPCAEAKTNCSPAQSAAVSVASDVVFSGSVDGYLRAYSAATGKVLWDTDTAQSYETVNGKAAHGGSMDAAGAAIVNGMVFVNSGYGQWGGTPGNVLLVFSVR
jgi:polyvinyl alcohol dehydrogenase (cytochrome)